MASFPLASIDCLLIAQEKRLNPSKGYSHFLGRRRTLSCSLSNCRFSAAPKPISLKYSGFRPQTRLLCSNKFRLVVNENANTDTSSLRGGNSELRKRFSLRLRPRFRLFSNKLRRNASIRSILDGIMTFVRKNVDGIMTFLRKNAKRVTFAASVSTVLCICFLFLKITAMPTPEVVPYSDLITSLQNGNVAKVLFEEETRRIYYSTKPLDAKDGETVEEDGSFSRSETFLDSSVVTTAAAQRNVGEGHVLGKLAKSRKSSPVWEFSTRKIDHDEAYLLSLIREKGISYSSAPQSVLTSMRSTLIMVLTLWIPLSPFMWILYRQFSAANSPARKRGPSNQLVCFEDVEGVDSAKVELMEIVCCLHGSINYKKLGAKLPRGVLLVGPPGTGKTLLARAVAGEAGVSFFSVSASEFVELFVGRGAARIRDLFVVARKNAPSIIFIDELDAVGGKRGRSFNDERDQTLNQLLTEMDGFESDSNIVVIAATNRPEALDPALCRPGRFSRKVFVGEPDEDGRKKILAIHFRNVPLEDDLGLICDLVASLTQGFVGADLANIANESALLAARRGAESVSREDIIEAVERAKFGISEKQTRPNTISKELGKLFPWMPSLINRNDARRDSTQGLLGYQTLS